ncbi:MAG: tripartite tricarboxylate transporter TctB family protein [Pseudorhodoplanes sp.]
MAEGVRQPADNRSQVFGRDSGPRQLGGVLAVVLGALLPPLVGYLTGPGGAFFTALSAFKFAPAFNAAFAWDIAKYSLPILVFAPPLFLGQVRNPQDYWGGGALAAFALFALWASSDLPGMRGFAFGPGTAPRLFSWLLVATGAGVALTGLFAGGNPLERWGVRAPVLFIASVVFFGATVRPLGLVISAFFTLMIASAASREVRWVEAVVWSAALTVFCIGLFVYGLNLPLQLWPR